MKEIAEKYALENALKYKGKASMGAVIGSVIKENPDAKKDMKKLKEEVSKVIEEVNKLSVEQQRAKLEKIAPELLEKKVHEKDIFSNFKAEGKVITAFPPEPSKYSHIGHAKALLVNYEYAKRNKGKFIIRFEDTNPDNAKTEFYQMHLKDYEWLGVKADEIAYASDHMEDFYKYAEMLIKKNHAYVCDCKVEDIKKSRMESVPCKHREQTADENLKLWKNIAKGSILRAKIDLEHKNTVMRDPTLFRIIEGEHCRMGSKYTVWPNYDFENAVMDGLQKVTHRFRSKEFELRSELQRYLQDLLGLPITSTYEFARFTLEGVETSGRVIRELVNSGKLIGWDDPSLATLTALRRRGFQAEAIKNFVLSTGLSKSESTLTWDDLIIHNRRVLDEESNRYFFVEDPVKIKIKDAPEQEIELHLHPEHRKGGRKFKVKDEFYITKKDFESLKDGKLYRFMECFNFKKKGKEFIFDSLDYKDFKGKGEKIMHFLPIDQTVEVEIMMPTKETKKGLAEPLVEKLNVGEVIQFERFGFCRLDDKNKFWFTHS